MSDRIVLRNMQFTGRHGYYEHELTTAQPFEVDVELVLNLQPAGVDDDLEKTVDYGRVYAIARQIVESTSYRLLEAIAEAISQEILTEFEVTEVGVRVRKPAVQLGGPLDHAAVEIWRRRSER
ncbi:MAG: dihydroneopterin aldolase [Chloroflexota bacterium]|jgi:dihydroneopterin aldolase|nr:dihydroneopterin aldolase [Chloroflexota bacterium]